MRDFSKPKLWLGIWIFGWLLCIVLSLGPPPPIPSDVPDGDKIGHTLAYFVLSTWAVMIFRTRDAWLRCAAALMALGIAIEFAQGALTTNRTADPYDALADALGILLGLGVALTPANNFLFKLERRWLS
ncbi:MAG TPA: VanZ family protein [Luteimonas sp.]|nr:VanZ family protein [Luteimonas sp.]